MSQFNPVVLFIFVSLLLAHEARAERAPKVAAPSIRPRLALPLMAKAPIIDGVLEDGEWRTYHAARFVGGKQDFLAERDGEFWVGTDGEKLYVAVRSAVHPTAGPVTAQAPRQEAEDAENLDREDAIEIWFSRTAFGGQGEYQVMITPAGAVFDAHHEYDPDLANHITRKPVPEEAAKPREFINVLNRQQRTEWTADLQHAHTVQDGTWVVEVALDLRQLGLEDLTQPFSLRVCRNFQRPKEQARWAPGVHFFATAGTMPLIAIDEAAPIVSELGFQDADGIHLAVEVTNPGPSDLPLEVRLGWQLDREEPATPSDEAFTLAPGETRRVELAQPLTDRQLAAPAVAAEIRVRAARRGLFYHRDVRFRPRSAGPLWDE